MSLRKSASETSEPSPEPKFHTLFAHCSNSTSCVTPRSSVIASYFDRPGDLRDVLGSPPSRCSMTSVVRLSAEHLLTPATYFPSHLTRYLKVLYGSKRLGLTVNWAMAALLGLDLPGELLDPDDDELGRLERCEADEDVDDAVVDVGLRRRLLVALDEVRLPRRGALEGPLTEEVVHERPHVEPDLRPQRLVVRLEDDPLGTAVEALLEEEREATNRDVLPLGCLRVGAVERASAPGDVAVDRERAQTVCAQRVEHAVLGIGQNVRQLGNVAQDTLGARRRLPYTSSRVGTCVDARDSAAGADVLEAPVVERIGH